MAEALRAQLAGGRLVLTLARPEVHNALDAGLIAALRAAVDDAGGRADVRYVVLAGDGPSFCAGGDLAFMRGMPQRSDEENRRGLAALAETLFAIAACPKPVIARVHGAALAGGMGLVAACDLAVAHPTAVFGLTEVRLGLVPAMVFPFLQRRVAPHSLRWAVLTGERFSATRALEMGLVHEVTEDLDAVLDRWGGHLAAAGPQALAGAKALFLRFPAVDWDEARRHTTEVFLRAAAGAEGQEGIRAFLEKRRPTWRGE